MKRYVKYESLKGCIYIYEPSCAGCIFSGLTGFCDLVPCLYGIYKEIENPTPEQIKKAKLIK